MPGGNGPLEGVHDPSTDSIRFITIGWEEVENRFNRLALAGKGGSEPVVKGADFGYCVGLQQSPEFASQLLRALRGRRRSTSRRRTGRDYNRGITIRELYSHWHRLTSPSFTFQSSSNLLFDICDRDMDGRINQVDIKQALLLSASTNRLSVTHEEAQEHAASIMEVLDSKRCGYIEPNELAALLRATLPGSSSSSSARLAANGNNGSNQEVSKSKAEILFRAYWRRSWILLIWLIICFSLFTWKFIQYKHRMAFEVMGYCLSTAKGAAETLKFNMALILLPVCRNTITRIRRSRRINSVVPFNDNINFHKIVAGGIVIGVILHGGTHLACDFPRISGSDKATFRQTIAADFGYHQPSYVEILATTEVATGILMVLLMGIAFILATSWPRRQSALLPKSVRQVTGYNTFWYSHHLLILVYALLIVHSMFLFLTNNIFEKTTWMYIAFPVMLYAGERIWRAVRSDSYNVEVLQASMLPGKVLHLKLQKPEGFKYKSGMYIFIQCPQISKLQWHPFSLTSGPKDDHLSVHMRALGDWSYEIYGLLQEAILSGRKEFPKIYIDGAYGAPSQDHVKYDIVMLIGLGIGATPFISILKDIKSQVYRKPQPFSFCRRNGPLRAYFYWVTREQSSFDWFRDSLKDISASNQNMAVIEVNNYLTTAYEEGDARSALITATQALHRAKTGLDMLSRYQAGTQFGRPNWFSIFCKLATRHKGERIGVFYCGPSALGKELEGLCTKFSTKTHTRFVFHKEHY
ncbi:Respiratory burst oxidase homolog protein F [Linum perenne]